MKSKLLQRKSYGVNQSREVVGSQQKSVENSSVPWRERENPPGRVSPTTGAQARKDFSVSGGALADVNTGWGEGAHLPFHDLFAGKVG
jgi:hypothetical protein